MSNLSFPLIVWSGRGRHKQFICNTLAALLKNHNFANIDVGRIAMTSNERRCMPSGASVCELVRSWRLPEFICLIVVWEIGMVALNLASVYHQYIPPVSPSQVPLVSIDQGIIEPSTRIIAFPWSTNGQKDLLAVYTRVLPARRRVAYDPTGVFAIAAYSLKNIKIHILSRVCVHHCCAAVPLLNHT